MKPWKSSRNSEIKWNYNLGEALKHLDQIDKVNT